MILHIRHLTNKRNSGLPGKISTFLICQTEKSNTGSGNLNMKFENPDLKL